MSLYLVSRNFSEKHPHVGRFFIPSSSNPEVTSFFGSGKFPSSLHSLCHPFEMCVKYTLVEPTRYTGVWRKYRPAITFASKCIRVFSGHFLKIRVFVILQILIQEAWSGAQEITCFGFCCYFFSPNFYGAPSSLKTKRLCFYGNTQRDFSDLACIFLQ